MTLAWYGHLKLQENGVSNNWPLIGVIAFSWMIAFFEYCCQVPANRLGFVENGGPFNLIQLKVIQECISWQCSASLPTSCSKVHTCIGTTFWHSSSSSAPSIWYS